MPSGQVKLGEMKAPGMKINAFGGEMLTAGLAHSFTALGPDPVPRPCREPLAEPIGGPGGTGRSSGRPSPS